MTVWPPFFTPRMVVPCQLSKCPLLRAEKWEAGRGLASRRLHSDRCDRPESEGTSYSCMADALRLAPCLLIMC